MQVRDIMRNSIITISENENLLELIAKFRKYSFHTLPVIDEKKKILGIVNCDDIMNIFSSQNPMFKKLFKSTHLFNMDEEDILQVSLPNDLTSTVLVSNIMSSNVVTIEEGENIIEARKLMKLHNIKKMFVTKNDVLVGLITLFDIIIGLLKEMDIIE